MSDAWNIVCEKTTQGIKNVLSVPMTLDRAKQSLRDMAAVWGFTQKIVPVFSGANSHLTAVVGDATFSLKEAYPSGAKMLHDMTKDELVGIIQDYQEMVSGIETILNANPKMEHRQAIRDLIYKGLD